MPWAAKTICTKPGCGVLVPKPGRCAAHLAQQRRDYSSERAARNDPTDRFYHTARWQRLRASVLAEEPLCRACQVERRVVVALVVDHIVPVKAGGAMWDRDNLQPLCNACHEAKSYAEGSRFVSRRRA